MTNKICTQAAPPKNRHPRHPREHPTPEYLDLFSPHYRSHCTFWSGRKRRVQKRDASSRPFTSGSRRSRKRRETRLLVPRPTRNRVEEDWNSAKYLYTALSLSLSLSISRVRCCFTTRPSYISQPVFNGYRVIKLLLHSTTQFIHASFPSHYSNLI